MRFEWLAPPPPETMIRALESLHALGALGLDAKVTGLGWRLVVWQACQCLAGSPPAPSSEASKYPPSLLHALQLTAPLGNHMAAMPLDPFLSKMLLEGCSRGCVQV